MNTACATLLRLSNKTSMTRLCLAPSGPFSLIPGRHIATTKWSKEINSQAAEKAKMPKPLWAPLLEYASGIEVRHLTTDEELLSAKQCLFQVYHLEQGWNPSPNPSNLRIEQDRFEDDIDAEWFGLFSERKLVGVSRVVTGLESALYLSPEEQERVFEAVNPCGQLRVCEINRTAVLPEHRGSLAMMWITAAGRHYAKCCGYDRIIGVAPSKLVKVYEERYGFTRVGISMKYDNDDPFETEIGYLRLGIQGMLDLLFANATWRAKRAVEAHKQKN